VTDNALEPPAAAGAPATGESTLARPPVSREDRARSQGYRSRFVWIYVVLAAFAGAGLAAFVLLVAKPDAAPAAAWSSFQPTGSDSAKSRQIAAHVANRYRLKNGQQMVTALAGPPRVSGNAETGELPVRAIAIRPDTTSGKAEDDDIEIVDTSSSLLYILCGLGQNCSIPSGTPSEERHALLRRQALELSLYTFKYLPDVNTVTVFLPPRPDGQAPPTAVFLRRGEVQNELGKPLVRTLDAKTPGIGGMKGNDLANVNRLTRPNVFQYEYQLAQDGSAILVFDPVPLGA
jgi:hypothetical protein